MLEIRVRVLRLHLGAARFVAVHKIRNCVTGRVAATTMARFAFMAAAAAFEPTDAFVYAASLNQVAVVRKWIARQFDANQLDSEGNSALCAAAQNQCLDVLDALLESGANVNHPQRDGTTPLHVACKWGRLEAAERLLASSAEIDARDTDGTTPLHYASRNGHEQLVEVLIDAGADLFLADQFGATATDVASDWQRIEIVRMLTEYHRSAFRVATEQRVQCVMETVGLGPGIPWEYIGEYLC